MSSLASLHLPGLAFQYIGLSSSWLVRFRPPCIQDHVLRLKQQSCGRRARGTDAQLRRRETLAVLTCLHAHAGTCARSRSSPPTPSSHSSTRVRTARATAAWSSGACGPPCLRQLLMLLPRSGVVLPALSRSSVSGPRWASSPCRFLACAWRLV